MDLVYDSTTGVILCSQTSNAQTAPPDSAVLAKMFPEFAQTASFCTIQLDAFINPVGGRIFFVDGIPRALLKNGNVLYELTEEELKKEKRKVFEKRRKQLLKRFPMKASSGTIEEFCNILPRLPQTLPAVSKALNDGSYFASDVHPVGWWGSFTDAGGYANMNREIVRRLHNYSWIPYIDMYPTFPQIELPLLRLLERYATLKPRGEKHPFVYAYTPMPHEYHHGKRIFFTMMETSSLHPVFVEHCNKFSDEVWVPSENNKEIFRSNGVNKKIHVVPLGIDELIYFSDLEGAYDISKAKSLFGPCVESGIREFKVLSVIQWNIRKGYDAVLKAFVNAFASNDDVCLVIATPYGRDTVFNDLRKHLPREHDLPQILVYNEIVPVAQMPLFYRNFDCYIHMSRGEGFSLTQIEAAACGIPVISCCHSGMTEYLNEANSFVIECPETEKGSPELQNVCYFYQGQWFWKVGKPQIDQAVGYMKNIRDNPSIATNKIELFRKQVSERYTWAHAASRVSTLLNSG